jgi:peroxiredoxin
MRNLAVGKLAPDFEGIGVDGKPLKLSDHRGKVVALVYWFSSCGPCLREIPHERELAQKMKGRPFALLGVVTDGRAEEARKVIEAEAMAWPNILKGGDKVAEQYHVRSNPSYFIIDAQGVIRSKGYLLPSTLDELVEKLVSETEGSRGH